MHRLVHSTRVVHSRTHMYQVGAGLVHHHSEREPSCNAGQERSVESQLQVAHSLSLSHAHVADTAVFIAATYVSAIG